MTRPREWHGAKSVERLGLEMTIEAMGMKPPGPHPETGESMSCCHLVRSSNHAWVDCLPPCPPARRVAIEWDEEDNEIDWRVLTEAEFAERMAEYEKVKGRTGFYSPGALTVSGEFETESGATAKGFWAGTEWHWTEWTGGDHGKRR